MIENGKKRIDKPNDKIIYFNFNRRYIIKKPKIHSRGGDLDFFVKTYTTLLVYDQTHN